MMDDPKAAKNAFAATGNRGRRLCSDLWLNTNLFVPLFALALLVNIGGCAGSLRIISFLEDGDVIGWDMSDGAMLNNAAGLMVFLFASTFGPLLVGLALPHLTGFRLSISRAFGRAAGVGLSLAVHFTIVAGCIFAVSFAAADLLQTDRSFNLEPGGPDAQYPAPSAIRQFMGGWLVSVYTLLGIAVIASAANLVPSIKSCACLRLLSAVPVPPNPFASPRHFVYPSGIVHALPCVAAGAALLGLLFFSTTILGPLWNTPGFLYIPFGIPVNETEDGALNWYSLSDATLRVGPRRSCVDDETCSDSVIHFKVYEDVCVFFGFLLGVSALALASSAIPAVRRLLHRHAWFAPLKCTPRWFLAATEDWRRGLCIGEIAVVLGFLGLSGWWFYYFSVRFDWIEVKARVENDPHPSLYMYSRVMGHMTNLFMAFLLLPVTRNSLWEACFGIPFERAIKYHRVLGVLCWASVTCHMVIWQCKWIIEGNLAVNVVTLTQLAVGPEAIHTENFTIPLAEFGWLTLTVALAVAVCGRRWSYNLFHVTHHLVWIYLFVAIIHAWSHWYYMAGGLILYTVDKLTRSVKSSRDVHVVSLSHAAGITRVELDVGDMQGSKIPYAGQYAFLCIPSVDPIQWHPFTISSPSSSVSESARITFHIKAVGPWTRKLAALCSAAESDALKVPVQSIHASIDGYYGCAGHFYESSSLLLVAGGIGITPMLSIMQELHAGDSTGRFNMSTLKRVRLVWVVREVELLVVFAGQIASIMRNDRNGIFSFALHVTGATPGLPAVGDALECLCDADVCPPASPARDDVASHARAGDSDVVRAPCTDNATPLPATRVGATDTVIIELASRVASAINVNTTSTKQQEPPAADTTQPRCHLKLAHEGWCSDSDARLVLGARLSGRPNMASEFSSACLAAQPSVAAFGAAPQVTAMVCGPAPLVNEVAALAAVRSTGFHCEVFSF